MIGISDNAAAAIGAGLPPLALFVAYLWCKWDERRGRR
jgi:hypothetical protein